MKEFLSGLTLGAIVALTTLLIVSVAIAQPNPGHSADQIGPGTFQGGGDYIFPSSSNIVMSDSGIYLRTDKFHGIKWSYNTNRFDGPTIFGYAGVSIEKRNETGSYSIANFTFEGVNISTNLRLPLYKKLYLGNSYLYGAMASGLDYVNAIGSFFVSDTFGADSPTLYVNASTHRVGIGTKYPSYKLDVVGDIKWGTKRGILSVDQGASIELGGTGKPYIDFSNDATTDYDMRIQLTSNDALSIQGGRVGIGTINPDPYVGLDIRNSESLGNRGQIIVDTYLLRSTPNLAYVPSDAAAHIDVYNDDLYIVLHNWDGTTGRGIYFSTKQGENQVGIKYGENVEIYSGDLDVQNGALYIKKDVGDWGRIARFYDPSMATDENMVIHLGKSDGGPAAEIGFRYRGDTSDQNILFLGHYAAPYIVNIRKDGKVGIGTDNPQVRLDVNGGVRIGDESTCNSDTQGTLRYYCNLDVCKCYFKICMRTGDTSYGWQNVLVTSWDCGIMV